MNEQADKSSAGSTGSTPTAGGQGAASTPAAGSTGSGSAATGGTALLATGIVAIFHHKLTAEQGALIAGGAATVAQFLWHTGLRRTWRHFMDGDPVGPVRKALMRMASAGF